MRVILALALLFAAGLAIAQVPAACDPHRATILRSAYRTFGPEAPTATLAAQTQQESGCNALVVSRVGAVGLNQFMPATWADVAARFPGVCEPADPTNAHWSIRCRDRLMLELLGFAKSAHSESDQWAFALSGYNGGYTWVKRDQKTCNATVFPSGFKCDPLLWWNNVELTPDPRRARWAVKENRGYPLRIMCVLAQRYESAGYGRAVECAK